MQLNVLDDLAEAMKADEKNFPRASSRRFSSLGVNAIRNLNVKPM